MDEEKRRAKLKEIIRKANREINDFDDAKRLEANAGMAGKCFRTQDSYSCPEKPEDYWWLYLQVTEVSANGYLSVWTFEQREYGRIRINPPEARPYLSNTYEEITAGDFWDAWHELAGKIQMLAGIGA